MNNIPLINSNNQIELTSKIIFGSLKVIDPNKSYVPTNYIDNKNIYAKLPFTTIKEISELVQSENADYYELTLELDVMSGERKCIFSYFDNIDKIFIKWIKEKIDVLFPKKNIKYRPFIKTNYTNNNQIIKLKVIKNVKKELDENFITTIYNSDGKEQTDINVIKGNPVGCIIEVIGGWIENNLITPLIRLDQICYIVSKPIKIECKKINEFCFKDCLKYPIAQVKNNDSDSDEIDEADLDTIKAYRNSHTSS
jgi:hypothetical protein